MVRRCLGVGLGTWRWLGADCRRLGAKVAGRQRGDSAGLGVPLQIRNPPDSATHADETASKVEAGEGDGKRRGRRKTGGDVEQRRRQGQIHGGRCWT
jgi:hypothetical protein